MHRPPRVACDPHGVPSILPRAGTTSCQTSADEAVKQAGKQVVSDRAPRPTTNENHLLISVFAGAEHSPLTTISKRVSDCGCNVSEARVAALGSELGVQVLAQGSWDAIAKLENALAKLERDGGLRIVHFRTNAKQQQSTLLPYVVEVIAADKPGVASFG